MNRTAKILFGVLAGASLLAACSCCAWLSCIHTFEAAGVEGEYRARVAPIDAALAAGRSPDPALVDELARDRVTRAYLAEVLEERGRTELLPPEHASIEARAEADLARWLVYPTELDAAPADMELAAIARLDDPSHGPVRYLALRFTAPPGHWATDRGWMFGISGPWPLEGAGSLGAITATGTFSELEGYSEENVRALVARIHGEQVGSEIAGSAISIAPVR